MAFHADLHVHSKYSRATSRDLDLEHLAWWAARKGIGVVGTGDCVHPGWLAEIKEKLVPAGGGLFRLKPEIETALWQTLPPSCRAPVRFMLSTEISTIYKKGDRTRKVHHLIYASDFASADRLAASLGRIGNIASDGRPILGLDSRNLLEVALESGPDSYLVPAHIWTPWFAALGSQSGFDSIDECYGDLTQHIFAVETGLSSDPAMNWRVSSLDRYRLTSNSDAHSPGKLGREATRFTCEPDYHAIRHALETGDGYGGTVEFFPEEGKYHMDGHRTCGVRWEPTETIAAGGRCPVCGSPVTVGVAHRVELLADRSEAEAAPPATAGSVSSLVPLPEILSEIVGSGVASQAVSRVYERALAALGPELSVLEEIPIEDIARTDSLLAEAATRLRSGTVIRQAGYDGEYGVIRLFEDGELSRFQRGDQLFDAPVSRRTRAKPSAPVQPALVVEAPVIAAPTPCTSAGLLSALDDDQARAAAAVDGPLLVVAGPGSGKTRMLTHRLAHLVLECGVPASSCLALTFTRRAAAEMRTRLALLLPGEGCAVHSFHSLGLTILRAHAAAAGLTPQFRVVDAPEWAAALAETLGVTEARAARLLKTVSVAKRTGAAETEAFAACRRIGQARDWVDFDDLVALPVAILAADAAIAGSWRARFRHICVDEVQDVDETQYRLLHLLAAPDGNLCAIGDPNQAIYGFRGADAACFERFAQDFPTARTVRLGRNYRSTGTIVTAAAQVIRGGAAADIMRPMLDPVTLHAASGEMAEAIFVTETIARLQGGHDMLTSGKVPADAPLSFADVAVLYRTDAQSGALRAAFDQAGIPFKKSSPAPIADHAAVQAVLDALAAQPDASLPGRLAAAAAQADGDPAHLAEARRWLATLAQDAADETAFREQVALSTEADFWDPRADRVSLLTMHAAKGLEFAVVFVVGLEDGVTPFSWGDAPDPADAAEERRLFYVAMTRAKDRLFLSRAVQRAWRGQMRTLPASPFLGAIPAGLVVEHVAERRRVKPLQFSLF